MHCKVNAILPEIKDISYQWYGGDVHNCKPKGFIFHSQYNRCTGSPSHPEIFTGIFEAKKSGDIALKAKLKEKLIGFTPAAIFDGWRKGIYITSFTGIAPTDWDNMTPTQAVEWKQYLFNHYPCFYSVHLSASGHGVRGLIKIPVVHSIPEYKQYFAAIEAEFSQYEYHFDTQLKTPVQLIFQGYDPNILYRYDAETWTDCIIPEPVKPSVPSNFNTNYTDHQRQSAAEIIFKGFKTRMHKVTNVGHPYVRSIAYTAGGYIAGGYIDESDAIRFMFDWIDTHSYLKQKADTYKQTVRDMINNGKEEPLTLKTMSQQPATKEIRNFLTIR